MYEIYPKHRHAFSNIHALNCPGQLVTEWLLRRLGDTGDGKKARPGWGDRDQTAGWIPPKWWTLGFSGKSLPKSPK